jgi:hypothetical protein
MEQEVGFLSSLRNSLGFSDTVSSHMIKREDASEHCQEL